VRDLSKNLHAQVITTQPQPTPIDTLSVLFEFQSGVTGTMASIRSTPFYWRIHLFGDNGSIEAIAENEIDYSIKRPSAH
jgi:predicted dehydrogenase